MQKAAKLDRHLRRRVLICEDDVDIARALSVLLRGHYDVAARGSAWSTVESFGLEAPDVLVVDYRLPDMDGIELVESIRKNWQVTVPAIMMSAYDDRREASLEAGFAAFIPKPFPPAEMIWAIENALRAV